jgi:hypothetical protein
MLQNCCLINCILYIRILHYNRNTYNWVYYCSSFPYTFHCNMKYIVAYLLHQPYTNRQHLSQIANSSTLFCWGKTKRHLVLKDWQLLSRTRFQQPFLKRPRVQSCVNSGPCALATPSLNSVKMQPSHNFYNRLIFVPDTIAATQYANIYTSEIQRKKM